MKNLLFFLLAVLSIIFSVIFGGCSQSQMVLGDKNVTEIGDTRNVFLKQIEHYQAQINGLREDNERLKDEATQDDSSNISRNLQQMSKNDSLVIRYQKKIDLLENQIDDLLVRSSKDQKNLMALNSSNPQDIASAYTLVKYMDIAGAKGDNANKPLIGIVENASYNKVKVTVTGPVNFVREYILEGNSKSPVFNLPLPGKYTATFTNGSEFRTVCKEAGFNIEYFDGNKPYNFKATLLP